MTLNSILQAVVSLPAIASGPTVTTAATAFAGIVLLFILDQVIKMRDKLLLMSGLPLDVLHVKEAVEKLNLTFSDHVNKEQMWQRELTVNIATAANRTQGTLSGIDDRLGAVEAQIVVNMKTLDTLSHGRRGK